MAETPSRLSRFIYDDLFGSGPVHFINRWSRVTQAVWKVIHLRPVRRKEANH